MDVPSSNSLYTFFKNSFSNSFKKRIDRKEDSTEIDLINNLEDYFSTTIREVMVPRTKMVTIDKNATIKEAIEVIQKTNRSRIPVQDKKPDSIVGILYAIDLFRYFENSSDTPVSEVMRKPFFVSYSHQIHHLLSDFKKKRVQLAIVIDEHGGVDGLISMEDVIEELVGDIPDEFNADFEPSYQKITDTQILMDANYPLSDFNELYNVDFQKEGIETIGGYICHKTGKIPKRKETITLSNIEFSVDESSEKRLEKLRISAPSGATNG